MTDLARDVVALQAEVVRLREALEGLVAAADRSDLSPRLVDAADAGRAALKGEALLARLLQDELVQLREWAREQNAGNAFAEQVAYWCSSSLKRLEEEAS